MSIEDDEYDLDDDVLDGAFEEDLEEGLEDFDEYDDEGGMSFDDDEVLFTDDELEEHEAQDEAAAIAAGAQKEKFRLNIGTDKLIIAGALIVGVLVLLFQVTTKKPAPTEEVFRSALTMKGASDGEVFGEGESTSIATTAPKKQEDQKAFLYEPDGLNQLPNNLKDGEHIEDVTIAPVSPEDAQKSNSQQSGFVQAERQSDDTSPSKGQFVSTTGRLVEQNVKPVERVEEQVTVSAPRRRETAQEERSTDIVEQDLNFVPIEQVAVKKETPTPSVPPVADKKIDMSIQTQNSQVRVAPVLTLDPIIQAQKEAAEQELMALKNQIAQLRQEKTSIEQQKLDIQAQLQAESQKAEMRKIEAEKEAVRAALKLEQAKLKAQKEARAEARQAATRKAEAQKAVPVKVETKPAKVVKKAVPKKTASRAVQTLPNWTLRAAQPDKAWISMSGKRDIVAVKVGDSVPNLGRVTAISKKNGKWVVMTTSGQITQ